MVKEKSVECEKCHNDGYVVERKGNFAGARICDCVKKCSECNGSGSVLSKKAKGYAYVTACKACGVVRRNVKLYNLAGVPAKYSDVIQVDAGFTTANNKSLQEALKYAKDFVKQYPPDPDKKKMGFLLMGKAGLGKTHLAIGTISELTLKHGVKCLFKDFFHLLSELKEAYSLGTPENEVILPLIGTEVLVIDELGKGRSNEWERNILDQLISKRYNASKITLITTNYVSRDEMKKQGSMENQEILEDRVGERIASRLYEMCEFMYLKGEDHRKTTKKA